MDNFEQTIDEYKNLINRSLDSLFSEGESDGKVIEAMKYSLLGSGKRIRGIIALACCSIFSEKICIALPAALSVEIVHCYSLIHDDLPCMDNDDIRRGKPSCHVKFGESTALLAGDALLTLGFKVLSKMTEPGDAAKCIEILSSAAGHRGMILGQELDIASTGQSCISLKMLNKIHTNKTGQMYVAAASMGAVAAKAPQKDITVLEDAFYNIGLSFQIIDDILDFTSDERTLGKPVKSDMKKGKLTYLSLYSVDQAKKTAADLTNKAIGLLQNRFKDKAQIVIRIAENLLLRIS